MYKVKTIAITGPTASGKTALAIRLAEAFSGEIISMDSMQLYRGMDIGTAKATAEERMRAPHHMLDIISPNEDYSAHCYKEAVIPIIEDIAKRGRLPILAGGTGLYLDTLRRVGDTVTPPASVEFRNKILSELHTDADKIALHKKLRELDPKSAETIHYNNVKRVIRAIEICLTTGRRKSELDAMAAQPDDRLDITHITLDFHNRDTLYERVNLRVLEMFRLGLTEEVSALLREGYLRCGTAGAAIGYKEIIEAMDMGLDPASATEKISRASRNYAKRQLTWFRHDGEAIRIYRDNPDGTPRSEEELFSLCTEALSERGII